MVFPSEIVNNLYCKNYSFDFFAVRLHRITQRMQCHFDWRPEWGQHFQSASTCGQCHGCTGWSMGCRHALCSVVSPVNWELSWSFLKLDNSNFLFSVSIYMLCILWYFKFISIVYLFFFTFFTGSILFFNIPQELCAFVFHEWLGGVCYLQSEAIPRSSAFRVSELDSHHHGIQIRIMDDTDEVIL